MDMAVLRLEKVDALLRQAGVALAPPTQVGETHYLQSVLDALCDLSSTDPLTGVMNRRAFLTVLEQELDRVTRGGEYALLLAVDIDHFKRINDSYGHPAGDLVLREVTQRLRDAVRPMDDVARIGGEEFAVLCPSCPPSFAMAVAQRARAAIEATPIALPGLVPFAVTVSVGGAFALPWVKGMLADWMARADRQLYRAKQEGRNCVRLEPVLSADVSAEEKGLLFGWTGADEQVAGHGQSAQ
jgi:diguanylate cyclase (GGDEF)-like protein